MAAGLSQCRWLATTTTRNAIKTEDKVKNNPREFTVLNVKRRTQNAVSTNRTSSLKIFFTRLGHRVSSQLPCTLVRRAMHRLRGSELNLQTPELVQMSAVASSARPQFAWRKVFKVPNVRGARAMAM